MDPKWRFCKVYSLCLVAIFNMFSIFKYWLFFGAVFCIEQLQCVVETFLACFYTFLIFDPKWRFCKVYIKAFAWWQFSKCSHFSNISCFFKPFFCTEQLQCVVETFLACFYAFLIFDPKWRFCKVYSLCLVAIFNMFSLFKYWLFFGAVFCIEQLQCVVETFLACFNAFLILDPKWRFCKVYSLCLVAIFNMFSIFEYWLFFGAVFCIEQLQCVVETFSACFYSFIIFDLKWRFCQVYSLCLVAIFNMFSFFEYWLFFGAVFCIEQLQCVEERFLACCRNVFSMFLFFYHFWPKVTILPSL